MVSQRSSTGNLTKRTPFFPESVEKHQESDHPILTDSSSSAGFMSGRHQGDNQSS
jgi:hypothetical protein